MLVPLHICLHSFSHTTLHELYTLPILIDLSLRFGSCGFRVAGPTIWNSLPVTVKTCTSISLKKQLKSHLFASALSFQVNSFHSASDLKISTVINLAFFDFACEYDAWFIIIIGIIKRIITGIITGIIAGIIIGIIAGIIIGIIIEIIIGIMIGITSFRKTMTNFITLAFNIGNSFTVTKQNNLNDRYPFDCRIRSNQIFWHPQRALHDINLIFTAPTKDILLLYVRKPI